MDLIDVPLVKAASPAGISESNSAGRVPVDDIEMYYEIHGQGEPLLLIMGLGFRNTSLYRPQGLCLQNSTR